MTIKQKVFQGIAKKKKGVSRKELIDFVFKAQGRTREQAREIGTSVDAYYSTNITDWVYTGWLSRSDNGLYKLTKNGKVYANEGYTRLLKLEMQNKKLKRRVEILEKSVSRWWNKYYTLCSTIRNLID